MIALRPDPDAAKGALRYFSTAFLFLLAGLSVLVWDSPLIANGHFLDTRVLGAIHFLTLGWLSLSIFGALRVFSGVALGSTGYLPWLSQAVWVTWATGVVLFPGGLITQTPQLIIAGIFLIGLGLLGFTVHFVPALIQATRGFLTRMYLSVALASLWCAWLLGSGAGFHRANWFPWSLPDGYFQAHLLLAIFGWVGATVVGVGTHLIPMFALSNKPKEWPAKAAFPFWALTSLLACLGAFWSNPFLLLGWICAAIGSVLWGIQVFLYFKVRIRKERDPGLYIAAAATLVLLGSWPIFYFADFLKQWPTRAGFSFIAVVLVGWLVVFTLGIYHRVIPFLVWFQRFADQMGKTRVPRVAEMVNKRLATLTGCLAVGGVLIWIPGVYSQSLFLVYLGSSMLCSAGFCTLGQLRTLLGKPSFQKPTVPNLTSLKGKA